MQPAMRYMAEGMLHDEDLAADAVQETLARLWHKRWRLGMMEEKKSFCMKVLRNQCVDIIRKQKQFKSVDVAMIDLADNSESAESAESRYEQLEKALATLSPREQELVRLRFIEQHSSREVAEEMGLTEGHVNTIMCRVYSRLRKQMSDE